MATLPLLAIDTPVRDVVDRQCHTSRDAFGPRATRFISPLPPFTAAISPGTADTLPTRTSSTMFAE
jgi:hypothetical protein